MLIGAQTSTKLALSFMSNIGKRSPRQDQSMQFVAGCYSSNRKILASPFVSDSRHAKMTFRTIKNRHWR